MQRFSCDHHGGFGSPCPGGTHGKPRPERDQVGGEGGWDYLTVDSAARRLYISRVTHVVIVDLDALKVVGDIPDTPGMHAITLATELNRGFVSNGRGNNVTIVDPRTQIPCACSCRVNSSVSVPASLA